MITDAAFTGSPGQWVTTMPADEIDKAVKRVRDAVEDVVEEAEELSEEAREEVGAAIDELEHRLKAREV